MCCSIAGWQQKILDIALLQMFYDDLPIWGFIGKLEKLMRSGEKPDLKFYLFTHIHFEIMYNSNRVVEINISTDPARTVDITEGENIIVDYTYSVKWKSTQVPYEKRMDKYSKYSFLPQHLEVDTLSTGHISYIGALLVHDHAAMCFHNIHCTAGPAQRLVHSLQLRCKHHVCASVAAVTTFCQIDCMLLRLLGSQLQLFCRNSSDAGKLSSCISDAEPYMKKQPSCILSEKRFCKDS